MRIIGFLKRREYCAILVTSDSICLIGASYWFHVVNKRARAARLSATRPLNFCRSTMQTVDSDSSQRGACSCLHSRLIWTLCEKGICVRITLAVHKLSNIDKLQVVATHIPLHPTEFCFSKCMLVFALTVVGFDHILSFVQLFVLAYSGTRSCSLLTRHLKFPFPAHPNYQTDSFRKVCACEWFNDLDSNCVLSFVRTLLLVIACAPYTRYIIQLLYDILLRMA